jgi:hypothetical protein
VINHSDADDAQRLRARRDLLARLDPLALTKDIVAAFLGGSAGYRGMSAAALEAVRRNVRHIAETVPAALAEPRMPTEAELAPIGRAVAERARAGIELEDVLHAYSLGPRIAWSHLLELARPGEERALAELADSVMEYVDSVSAVVARAFIDETQHERAEQDRLLRRLLDTIQSGGVIESDLAQAADRIGFDLDAPRYVPFVFASASATRRACSEKAAALRAQGALATAGESHITGLVVPDRAQVLEAEAWLAVIDEPTPRDSLGDVLDTIRLLAAAAAAEGSSGVITLDELLPEAILARSPHLSNRLLRQLIEPLAAHDDKRRGGALIETLGVYLRTGLNRAASARHLHLHPNSLDLRLRRVQQLTGTDLRSVRDIVRLWLALRARQTSSR